MIFILFRILRTVTQVQILILSWLIRIRNAAEGGCSWPSLAVDGSCTRGRHQARPSIIMNAGVSQGVDEIMRILIWPWWPRSPSRTDSGESGGRSHLRVPLNRIRARGISLPDGMEESLTKNNSYLLRQYNIKASRSYLMDCLKNRNTKVMNYPRGRRWFTLETLIIQEKVVWLA